MITSGFSPSILLKIGVKSVVSGEKRMWSSTFRPISGRHFRYSASSGVVQAASSLMTTAVFMCSWSTSRSLAGGADRVGELVEVR